MSLSVMLFPLAVGMAIACLVFQPHQERAANVSGTVLLLNLTAAAAIATVLNVYAYSQTMAAAAIAVLMIPHAVLYVYGAVRLARFLRERATAIGTGRGLLYFLSPGSEGTLLLDK